MIRWSNDIDSVTTSRTASSPSCTHGRWAMVPRQTIALSPGLRIGVPPSTPKTPTFVMLSVPPDRSAGRVCPSRAVEMSAFSAPASSGSDEAAGVLDVRHDQPARGRDGEARG